MGSGTAAAVPAAPVPLFAGSAIKAAPVKKKRAAKRIGFAREDEHDGGDDVSVHDQGDHTLNEQHTVGMDRHRAVSEASDHSGAAGGLAALDTGAGSLLSGLNLRAGGDMTVPAPAPVAPVSSLLSGLTIKQHVAPAPAAIVPQPVAEPAPAPSFLAGLNVHSSASSHHSDVPPPVPASGFSFVSTPTTVPEPVHVSAPEPAPAPVPAPVDDDIVRVPVTSTQVDDEYVSDDEKAPSEVSEPAPEDADIGDSVSRIHSMSVEVQQSEAQTPAQPSMFNFLSSATIEEPPEPVAAVAVTHAASPAASSVHVPMPNLKDPEEQLNAVLGRVDNIAKMCS